MNWVRSWKASISSLLLLCCPSTVFWSVRTVIINSINGMRRRWSFSHVGKKCFETFAPLRTNRNSSTAVRWVFMIFRIVATLDHRTPRVPFRSSCKAVPEIPVGRSCSSSKSSTSATSFMAIEYLVDSSKGFFSAITTAKKVTARTCLVRKSNYIEFVESLAGDVSWFWSHLNNIANYNDRRQVWP